VPHPENPLDKQIAVRLPCEPILIKCNVKHFADTGVNLPDPLASRNNGDLIHTAQ
jgi:hypothetical protein